jgi:hypothetical protein
MRVMAHHRLARRAGAPPGGDGDRRFPTAELIATRTPIQSPFVEDPEGTLYAGGYDAGNQEPHNTAWLYRGVPLP